MSSSWAPISTLALSYSVWSDYQHLSISPSRKQAVFCLEYDKGIITKNTLISVYRLRMYDIFLILTKVIVCLKIVVFCEVILYVVWLFIQMRFCQCQTSTCMMSSVCWFAVPACCLLGVNKLMSTAQKLLESCGQVAAHCLRFLIIAVCLISFLCLMLHFLL